MSGHYWRLFLYIASLVAPILVGIEIHFAMGRLNQEIIAARQLSIGGSDNARLEVEYYRFRDGIERFVTGDVTIDFDEMLTRFDIVWSRAEGMSKGPELRNFSDEAGLRDTAKKLLNALQVIEPQVEQIRRSDVAELALIRDQLVGFEQPLATGSIKLTQLRQERAVEVRGDLALIVEEIRWMGLIVLVIAVCVIILFFLEAHYARLAQFRLHRREERAQYLAHHDSLTGLANRTLFLDELQSVLRAKDRPPICLLALDLDGFKGVNDTYGHLVGDELLRVVADRLRKVVDENDLVARLGGDEFAIVLNRYESVDAVSEVSEEIIREISRPILLGGYELHVSTSIGIVRAPEDGETKEVLLRRADVALYEAKDSGRQTVCWFKPEMDEIVKRRQQLEIGLRQAFDEQRLEVYYQPQVDLQTKQIVGVEALARWHDPALGEVAPSEFIGIANHCGLIFDLGNWITETSCRCAASWSRMGVDLPISINLSPAQLHHPEFLTKLDDIIARTGIARHKLTLEITEDLLLHDDNKTLINLLGLQQRGLSLAIDDFGSGYSNMGYLKRLPLQYLKIDQTFIQDIELDQNNQAIIKSITGLANSLDLKTIAEGVESESQRQFLLRSGCRMAQGFLFHAPMSDEGILQLLRRSPSKLASVTIAERRCDNDALLLFD